jgi:PAS domain S-box-containing protein
VLVELNRPREGMPYLERAFQMDREAGNSYGQAKELSNLGGAAENLKEWDRARDYHRRALALREEIGDKEGIVRSSGALGSLAFRQGDAGAAIPMLQRAVAVAASINDPRDEADNSALLSKALEARGDLAGALAAARRFHDLQTTLNEAESRSRLAELETRYRSRERDRELASLATLADSRRQQLRWVIAGSALLAGCLVLLGILYVLRGRTQRALGESEQRYRALFQNSVIPTFLLDVEHRRVIDLNEPACALCGGAAPGVDIAAIEPEWVRRALTRLFESGAADIIAFDDRWTDAQGALRWTEIRGSAVALGRRACRLVALRDATDLHTREAARQQAENLRSLGVLAGGIAHDFNNALMSISGYVDLAKDADPIERRDMLELAHAAAMAARQLTGQLLSLARGGEPRRRITNVGRLLQDTLTLTGAGSHMRVSVEIPDGLWNAHLDAGQFRQVVSNLVINAQQATAEGGELHVTASNVVGHFGSGASPEAQRFVRLDFADNGKGIPEAIRHQVFDPYFTTKTGGTGLGLTTAFAVCRNHGGMLTFESSEGRGTTFSAFFPATSDAVSDSQPVTATTPDGKGRILVMDDEPMIRNLLSRMLEQWGFSVEAVEDGQRAVDRYAEQLQRGSPFDLLIMDLTIPGGMGGRKAMAEILKSDPHARAIVASGYSDDPTMANYRDAGFVAALAKPFQSAELAEALNVVLKERGQTRTL